MGRPGERWPIDPERIDTPAWHEPAVRLTNHGLQVYWHDVSVQRCGDCRVVMLQDARGHPRQSRQTEDDDRDGGIAGAAVPETDASTVVVAAAWFHARRHHGRTGSNIPIR